VQVIGAGLGGTGTRGVMAALEVLGIGPGYHISAIRQHPEQLPLWQSLAAGDDVDLTAIFGAYEASGDFPACVLYAELMQAYPDAKVLLTVSDYDRAYDRLTETGYKFSMSADSPMPPPLRDLFARLVWEGVYGGAFEDRAAAIATHRAWDAAVRERVPADRLLVYDAAEGWEPLCSFLGRAVPDAPMPD
jgi:hypothetical protein